MSRSPAFTIAVIACAFGGCAALYGLGIPENSILQYETALKSDAFLVMAHDTPTRIAMARKILAEAGAARVGVHDGLDMLPPALTLAAVG